LIFELIHMPIVENNPALLSPTLGLVAPLSQGARELVEASLSRFLSGLRHDGNIFEQGSTAIPLLNGFFEFIAMLPVNAVRHSIRDAVLRDSIANDAFAVLLKRSSMDPGQSRWADAWQRTVDGIAELPAVLKT
jgi:hypothetical protein